MVKYQRDNDGCLSKHPHPTERQKQPFSMKKIMEYARNHAYQGGFIGLMAAKGAEDFYTKYGFFARPTPDYGPGMILFWQIEKKER